MVEDILSGAERECPSRWKLERYRAGEIDGAEKFEVESHVKLCAECREKLEEIEELNKAFIEDPRSGVIAETLIRAEVDESTPRMIALRGSSSKKARSRLWVMFPAAVAACAAVVALLVIVGPEHEPEFITKGDAFMIVEYFRDGELIEKEDCGALPGDQIQLSWTGTASGYLAVFAKDVDGGVEVVYPVTGAVGGFVRAGVATPVGPGLAIGPETKTTTLYVVFRQVEFSVRFIVSRLTAFDCGARPEIDGFVQQIELPICAPGGR